MPHHLNSLHPNAIIIPINFTMFCYIRSQMWTNFSVLLAVLTQSVGSEWFYGEEHALWCLHQPYFKMLRKLPFIILSHELWAITASCRTKLKINDHNRSVPLGTNPSWLRLMKPPCSCNNNCTITSPHTCTMIQYENHCSIRNSSNNMPLNTPKFAIKSQSNSWICIFRQKQK